MKKLIPFLFAFLFISCNNNDSELPEPDNTDETWLKISNIIPKSGNTVTVNTPITFIIEYNIAPGVLEMEGFSISVKSKFTETDFFTEKKWVLTNRSGKVTFKLFAGELITYNKTNQIYLATYLTQYTSETTSKIIAKSDFIQYTLSK